MTKLLSIFGKGSAKWLMWAGVGLALFFVIKGFGKKLTDVLTGAKQPEPVKPALQSSNMTTALALRTPMTNVEVKKSLSALPNKKKAVPKSVAKVADSLLIKTVEPRVSVPKYQEKFGVFPVKIPKITGAFDPFESLMVK